MTPRLRRCEGNPILTPTSRWWEARRVSNCGAAVYQGRVHLLYRAQGLDFISRWGLAVSDDGLRIVSRSQHPVFEPAVHLDQERLGCEDPRITPLGGRFYITYTAASVYPAIGPGRRRPAGAFSREGVPWRVRIGLGNRLGPEGEENPQDFPSRELTRPRHVRVQLPASPRSPGAPAIRAPVAPLLPDAGQRPPGGSARSHPG
jgi:hypothetical protein